MATGTPRHGPVVVAHRDAGAATVDLHTHTDRSDGLLRPGALVRDAAAVGVRLLAITDHDTLAGIRELRAADAAAPPRGIEVVAGVEINAVEDGGGMAVDGELHILGYGLDLDDDALEATLERQRNGRRRRFDAIVERLRGLGMGIDDQVAGLDPGADDALGRPTIARALVAGGHASSVEEAFERILARGRPAYLPRQGLGPIEAIRTIRAAGGIPVLAHFAEASARRAVVAELRDAGLAGLEVYYRTFDEATVAAVAAVAAELALLPTGGSDYHGDTGPYVDRHAELHIPDAVGEGFRRALDAVTGS